MKNKNNDTFDIEGSIAAIKHDLEEYKNQRLKIAYRLGPQEVKKILEKTPIELLDEAAKEIIKNTKL